MIDSVGKAHPYPKVKAKDITDRDCQWSDIGSGVIARTFRSATRLPVTSKGGPCISDIYSKKVWSLSSGKLLDDSILEDTPDSKLKRELAGSDDIGVEMVLKDAIK